MSCQTGKQVCSLSLPLNALCFFFSFFPLPVSASFTFPSVHIGSNVDTRDISWEHSWKKEKLPAEIPALKFLLRGGRADKEAFLEAGALPVKIRWWKRSNFVASEVGGNKWYWTGRPVCAAVPSWRQVEVDTGYFWSVCFQWWPCRRAPRPRLQHIKHCPRTKTLCVCLSRPQRWITNEAPVSSLRPDFATLVSDFNLYNAEKRGAACSRVCNSNLWLKQVLNLLVGGFSENIWRHELRLCFIFFKRVLGFITNSVSVKRPPLSWIPLDHTNFSSFYLRKVSLTLLNWRMGNNSVSQTECLWN